ncbi:AHH domain-containing protein [Pseudobutyrivibrio sp.]|uniref:AHH domain-containing protein n=1 Tax=Pseudobutyrivibrio sp. TaxID=2014367 RepID=UPI003FA79818
MVSGADSKAQEARDVLQSFGIGINDSVNGVFLPTVRDVCQAVYHPEIHTNIYYAVFVTYKSLV